MLGFKRSRYGSYLDFDTYEIVLRSYDFEKLQSSEIVS